MALAAETGVLGSRKLLFWNDGGVWIGDCKRGIVVPCSVWVPHDVGRFGYRGGTFSISEMEV